MVKPSSSRRLFLVPLLLVFFLSLATPRVEAGPGQTFHFKVKESAAFAFWTTFPQDAPPQPNIVYTDTFLVGAEQAVVVDGQRFEDKFALVDVFRFKFDRRGNFIFVSATFGFAGGSDVSYAADRALSAASLQAVFALVTCAPTRRGEECTDAGTGAVDVGWTGTGDVVHIVGNFHANSKTFTFNSHFNGKIRGAVAGGTVLGGDPGQSLFAEIFRGQFGDIFVCHGC